MLSAPALLFTSLLAGFAVAQNTTFDPSSIDLTTKSTTCFAHPDPNEAGLQLEVH